MPHFLPTFGSPDPYPLLTGRIFALPWMNPLWNRTTGSGSVADADYGDITVSSSGAVWTIDNAAVTEAKIGLSDNTTNDVSTTKHGFAPKSPNDATKFLDGTGAYSVPTGTGSTPAVADRSSIYKVWTSLSGDDDEFDDASFSGWTAVNSGSHLPTLTEGNDVLSIDHPGSDATAELHAWVKAKTINANDYVEGWFSYYGRSQSSPSIGVIMANGNTYGAGTQVFWELFQTNANAQQLALASHTNYSTAGTASTLPMGVLYNYGVGLRLQYLGSNNWAGFMSVDGISWRNFTGTLSRTMTPTHAGFFVSTWGGTLPMVVKCHYCRFSS
jgi:hypothetical protein